MDINNKIHQTAHNSQVLMRIKNISLENGSRERLEKQ